MFANVQSFGRAMQSSIRTCPGSSIPGFTVNNNLLYLTVAPIVHGARGICFYSLGMALRSGPVGSSSTLDEVRVPAVLTSWGPSPDGSGDVNMVTRVHETVATLTGSGSANAPDFTEIVTDESQFDILDETEAYNAEDSEGLNPQLNSTGVNFIAYEETASGDIYLIVSRDNAYNYASWIVFPNTNSSEYGTAECFGGWNPTSLDKQESRIASAPVLAPHPQVLLSPVSYNFGSMPSYSASLLRIPYVGTCDGAQLSSGVPSMALGYLTGGCSHFIVSNVNQSTEVNVYDLSGRAVMSVELSSDQSSNEFTLDRSVLRTGLYFVSLTDQVNEPVTYKVAVF